LKLVHFRSRNKESYGIQIAEDIAIDLLSLSQRMKQTIPANLNDLIRLDDQGLAKIRGLINAANKEQKAQATISLRNAKLLAPISSPPKIICLGLNYHDHIAETKAAVPDDLVIFMKPHTAVLDPEDSIIKPSFVEKLDYEAELAVVIGTGGKSIRAESAKNHIFGCTCFNDVSARDIQFKDKQWTRGKSFDTFAPMGPCITTSEQIGDPNNLRIRTYVNDELRQNSSTCNMVFNAYEVVSRLSNTMTLEPGDIIATGTPAGVGFAMKPKPKFLKLGDIVEVEIQNIGVLRNKVARAS